MVKSWNVYTCEEIKTIREHADCTFFLLKTILLKALHRIPFLSSKPEKVYIFCGDILHIDAKDKITQSSFDDSRIAPIS